MCNCAIDTRNDAAAEAINREAAAWMKRGLALLNDQTTASLKEAIRHFNQAIELRCRLPLEANPLFRYGLAASWMNRGDALTRLGSSDNLAKALQAYDAALAALLDLPLDLNPLFRRRKAIAWQNRGLVLQAQGAWPAAGHSFGEAVLLLQHEGADAISDRDYLLSTAWTNNANALAHNHAMASARAMAKQALALTIHTEDRDLVMAEVGLQARLILCQTVAGLLEMKAKSDLPKDELTDEATDAVDDGMTLAQSWEKRDSGRLRPLARELFRFGARAYQIFHPSFLGEFLLENLDPAHASGKFVTDPEMHAIAMKSLWEYFREIQRQGVDFCDKRQLAELCGKLRSLQMVDDRLTELRGKFLTPC